ncbi:MAG: alkaline phosphatase D family protein [Planctomycetaceae bacterium]
MTDYTRRLALKILGAGAAWLGVDRFFGATTRAADGVAEKEVSTAKEGNGSSTPTAGVGQPSQVGDWHRTHDRVFLGGEFWANPMEDWRIVEGGAECQSFGGNRNVHRLLNQIVDATKPFMMSVVVKQVEKTGPDGGAGFRIGCRSDVNDVRANVFQSNGIDIGFAGKEMFVGRTRGKFDLATDEGEFTLRLSGKPVDGGYELTLSITSMDGKVRVLTHLAQPQWVTGNVAIVNTFDPKAGKQKGTRYRFSQWMHGGEAFSNSPEHRFGPLLWTNYSLSDSRGPEGFVLKLSALTGPLGAKDNHQVTLQIQEGDGWNTIATAELDTDAWVATFRVPQWNEKVEHKYRVVYRENFKNDTFAMHEWGGTIKANPSGRPLGLGALTCQNDYAFPYAPVLDNLVKLDPDMLYFSGDQLYENHGGYGVIRDDPEMAILNYLRKFYQHGWAFREAMKDRPTLCIPDDHDVFQGNIWGEGGRQMRQGTTSSEGGYRQPARMVNVVHRTCTSHHPDFYDPAVVEQEISVYFGDMVYGGVSFAVLGDRQWKSGPERVETGSGRADHVLDPKFDTSALDKPGLVLLGERQEAFLKAWSKDWRGHTIKVLLSQTVLAGVATHHGGFNGYLKADLDSGGWPQTPRNRAIDIIRESKALHINGDQHLTTLVQYGVDKQRDSNWSFCTPAIAVGYPRWWRPDELNMPHEHRPAHNLPNTGEFIDGLGNKAYVYAVGNPEVGQKKHRYELAHQKGSGFGLVTIDTEKKTYHIESFRFLIDATDGKPENQFPGWPVTIHQDENAGINKIN